jgi:hypothetical protein
MLWTAAEDFGVEKTSSVCPRAGTLSITKKNKTRHRLCPSWREASGRIGRSVFFNVSGKLSGCPMEHATLRGIL